MTTGRELAAALRRISTMRGTWPGYDVTCSCGWESRTGGGVRAYVEDELAKHRSDAQWKKEHDGQHLDPRKPCTDCRAFMDSRRGA